jgi:Domain of unknown function (DUF4920)
MRSLRSVLPLVLLLAACKSAPPPVTGTSYGEALTLTDTTKVSDILAAPQEWVGRRVLVAGTVVQVCQEKGCWIQIASDREHEMLKVKVEDGVIVFPMTAMGHPAVVEGTIEALPVTAEQARAQARRHAEETQQPFDSTRVFADTTLYQIRGLGAFIAD